jgi:hypothetical protein
MYLYRKWRRAVTLAAALVMLSPAAGAQWRRAPQPERKTPRAVAVLETYAEGQRRLIPVSFFYERRYYDAGLYRAAPVPFTLSTETVYEVEQFGQALGTFTVLSAMREANQGEAAWFGSGRYRVAPDPATLAKKKAAAQLVAVEDSTRPVLHRREGSEGDRPAGHSAANPAAAKNGAPNADDDPERPVLHRRDEAGDGKTAASGTSASPTVSASAKQAEAGTAGEVATADQEPDRPILRRGKPKEQQGGPDLPEFNPALVPALNPGTGEPGVRGPAPMARQVAVSDAGTSEAQDVIFACRPEQRQQMEAQARKLAEDELRKAAPTRGLVLPETAKSDTAKVAKTGSAKTKAPAGSKAKAAASSTATSDASQGATPAAEPEALTLDDEQFVPYGLDYNDYATVVFSGRYRPGAKNQSWVVTVIARQDGDKLVKLYSAVSDPKELDLYPEVRLVDAVDPDGYGRYALLFREQKRDGVSWLLGRVSGYELQTLFETAER